MAAKQAAVGVRPVRPCRGYRRDGGQRRLRERFEGTFSDAVARRQEMVAELGGSACAGQTDVIRDFWPLFMRRCRAKGLTNETIGGYESSWRLRIEPAFGDLRWPELSYPMVQSWVYGMTPAVAKKSVKCLKRMINCAVDAELVDRNVLDHRRIDYPVEREDPFAEQPVMWGAPQVAEAMRRLRGDDAEALFLALVGGGLRVEEGLGLMWSRLRFSEVSRLGEGDGLMAHAYVQMAWTERDGFKAPKNKFSRRVAPIPDPFASRPEGLPLGQVPRPRPQALEGALRAGRGAPGHALRAAEGHALGARDDHAGSRRPRHGERPPPRPHQRPDRLHALPEARRGPRRGGSGVRPRGGRQIKGFLQLYKVFNLFGNLMPTPCQRSINNKTGRRAKTPRDLRFLWWAQQDSNLQPRDYEELLSKPYCTV